MKNVEASADFYEAALGTLGVVASRSADEAGFGPKGAPALWLHRAPGEDRSGHARRLPRAGPQGGRSLHAAGLKAGGRDNGKPGLRADSPTYYAAFLIDPDGNNVEAVCMD